jgi:polyisoprenoid-binding protein YceI
MSTITQETLPAGIWSVDPVHSHVGFAVQYTGGVFRGGFSPVEARLEVAEDGAATLTGSTPVSGVRVQDENLEAHLQSPDFFDAERTPEIRFVAREVRRTGSDVEIAGDLTIKGTTLPVEARGTVTEPVDDAHGGVRYWLRLEAGIDRTRFGLNWNDSLPSGEPALANDVTLTAELYLVKE